MVMLMFMVVAISALFAVLFGGSNAPSNTAPMPSGRQTQEEEWLAMKDSGKAHRFYVAEALNPYYKHSVCGFETTADKVKAEGGDTTRCKRCLLMKG